MQTGSSGTLIGLKSGQTTYTVSLSVGPNGGIVAMDSVKYVLCVSELLSVRVQFIVPIPKYPYLGIGPWQN